MTGIVIVSTGAYKIEGVNGVLMTTAAFDTVSPWFSVVLSFVVFLFAFSTMLTYGYYGAQAWSYITKGKKLILANLIFVISIFVGGMLNLSVVIDLADIFFLSMSIPNLIGLYIMRNEIKADTKDYIFRLKSGEIEETIKK